MATENSPNRKNSRPYHTVPIPRTFTRELFPILVSVWEFILTRDITNLLREGVDNSRVDIRDDNLTRELETQQIPTRWMQIQMKLLTRGCNPHLNPKFHECEFLFQYAGDPYPNQNMVCSLFCEN